MGSSRRLPELALQRLSVVLGGLDSLRDPRLPEKARSTPHYSTVTLFAKLRG